jgi:hypothetical protein
MLILDLLRIPISKQPELLLVHNPIGDHGDLPEPCQYVDVSDMCQDWSSLTVHVQTHISHARHGARN